LAVPGAELESSQPDTATATQSDAINETPKRRAPSGMVRVSLSRFRYRGPGLLGLTSGATEFHQHYNFIQFRSIPTEVN
jgi:hypothetical protein